MYKSIFSFLLTLSLCGFLSAQSGDYIQAFEYYNSAKDYCPEKGKVVDGLVQGIILQIDKDKRHAYANDLVYKSEIALERGDRVTAFRLAEFAHRYVDDDNLQVTNDLVQALYNDHPTRPPFPWVSNLKGHSDWVSSVAFSPDGSRLAMGSSDGTAIIWDLERGKAILRLEGHSDWGR
jgi:hypothetical protein